MIDKEVFLGRAFTILDINYEQEWMQIQLRFGEMFKIPLYISGLNIYLPEYDYCMPGRVVGKGHPDYWDVDYTLESDTMSIKLDEDFHKNGKYTVKSKKTQLIIQRVAQIYKPEEVKELLNTLINETFEGEMIRGIATRAYIKQNGKIRRYVDTSIEIDVLKDCFVVVVDPVTYVEINLPRYLWKLKS